MQKNRSTTPCLGICSTTYGDDVCKGCKRFVHEIISWPKYSQDERALVNDRLEKFKVLILQDRFKVHDKDLFQIKLKENAINRNKQFDKNATKIEMPSYGANFLFVTVALCCREQIFQLCIMAKVFNHPIDYA